MATSDKFKRIQEALSKLNKEAKTSVQVFKEMDNIFKAFGVGGASKDYTELLSGTGW